jgi:hypothetical protein
MQMRSAARLRHSIASAEHTREKIGSKPGISWPRVAKARTVGQSPINVLIDPNDGSWHIRDLVDGCSLVSNRLDLQISEWLRPLEAGVGQVDTGLHQLSGGSDKHANLVGISVARTEPDDRCRSVQGF